MENYTFLQLQNETDYKQNMFLVEASSYCNANSSSLKSFIDPIAECS